MKLNIVNNNDFLHILLGRTITKITPEKIIPQETEQLTFETADGFIVNFYHEQDCCESVSIESVDGDLTDLIGTPLLMSEEISNVEDMQNPQHNFGEWDDSHTWTFYKFATIKGYVTVRWLGESNGYYSESVDLEMSIDKELQNGEKGNNWIYADGIISYCSSVHNLNGITYHYGVENVVAEQNGVFAHGKNAREALQDLSFKLAKRNISKYKSLTLESVLTYEEAIMMYRVITGACSAGTNSFLNQTKPEIRNYTVNEIIKKTSGQYGNEILKDFFNPVQQLNIVLGRIK
jgi:hypothetical protein